MTSTSSESLLTSAARAVAVRTEGSQFSSPAHQGALRRFAIAITALTVLGHAFLGFEQSYAQPLVAIGAAYATQLILETVEAWCRTRRPRYAGGSRKFIDFLLSAHITALAVAMLLYYNDRLLIVAFAAATSVASKYLFRAPVGQTWRHFFNPSNFGITTTLLLFPWVGLLPPWQFTANVSGAVDWILPIAIFALGSYLHVGFAKRMPLIASWLIAFVLQAVIRWCFCDSSLPGSLAPMTGVAFVLFTFYMVPDPVTTPERPWHQVLFGGSVAAAYGVLMALHVVYGLFIALTLVCAARGLSQYVRKFCFRHVRE